MTSRLGTKSPGEREDGEAERLVRPAPKKKPPRHDRRREEMKADHDGDTDGDPDLKSKDRSLNYKTIGGSMAARVIERYAAEGGRIGRIPARSKETGKVVFISEKSLRENPDKYEKYKPEKDKPSKPPTGEAKPSEKPKPPRPDKKSKPTEAQPGTPEPAIAGDEPPAAQTKEPGGAPQDPPKDPGTEKPKEPESSQAGAEDAAAGEDKSKPGEEAGEPKRPVSEKLGIPPPKRRDATAAEQAQVAILLADTLPPELAERLISSGLHPDDARVLVGSYRAVKRRPVGSLGDFAAKAAQFHETDPDRVAPPKSWRSAEGKTVAFEQLPPEEQADAYRKHQMQVVAASLAAEHVLEEKVSFGKTVSPVVAKLVSRTLLGKVKPEAVPKLAEEIFERTAGARDFVKLGESAVGDMLAKVKDNEGARSLLQSYLEANDYKRAKDLYLGRLSERDKPAKILERLTEARHFFKVRAGAYGTQDGGHGGQKRFETRTLSQLRQLSPKTYEVVRQAIDEKDAKEYRAAKKEYQRQLAAFEKAHKAWQAAAFSDLEPKPPKPPIEPLGYSRAKSPKQLAEEGRQLWKDLQDRSSASETPSRVASRFISTYLAGTPMHRTANRQARQALYHGVSPGEHYPREHYPKWQPVPSRDLADVDHEAILTAARTWLESPEASGSDDSSDLRFRLALDLALSTGLYKPDVQTYELLLAKLSGSAPPALVKDAAVADERNRLERAVYARFPPDSRRKAGGKLTVMLTGATATQLGRGDFSLVALSDLSKPELRTLAKTMRVVTSSFDARPSNPTNARATARDLRKPVNGASQMLRLSSEEKTTANQILANFDQLAQSIQRNYQKWGMSAEAAKRVVNQLDKTADEAETLFFGPASLNTRQAEIALRSASFVEDVVDSGLMTKAQVSKAARVLQRDSDEPYMDTFKNPMSPIETDSDEPYMSAYGDDQSSAVLDGEDDTGRALAPEA